MARRRVAVDLTLEAADYLGTAAHVRTTTRTTEHAIHELGDEADSTGRDLEQMAANTDVAKHAVDKLGDKARTSAMELAVLHAEIARVKREALELHAALAAGDLSAIGKIGRNQSQLRRLERTAMMVRTGGRIGAGFAMDFSNTVSESRGVIIASLVGIAVAAAPLLLGALAGAVVGAVGIGGVVGGAFLAARSPQVQAAWKVLGSGLLDELTTAAHGFEAPMIRAAATFKRDFHTGGWLHALEDASKLVDDLSAGLSGFIRELGPGFDAAFVGAQPVIRMLAMELPRLGRSISVMLAQMAADGPKVAAAFGDLLKIIDFIIIQIGVWTRGAAILWDRMKPPAWIRDLLGLQEESIAATDGQAQALDTAAQAAADYADALKQASDALSSYLGIQLSLDAANLAVERGFIELTRQLQENRGHFGGDAAGVDNRDALRQQIDLLNTARERAIAEGQGSAEATAKANEQFDLGISKLERMASQAGATKKELDKMFGKYHFSVTLDLAVAGLAVFATKEIRSLFKGLGFASGGRPPVGHPYLVGERGPELRFDDPPGYVMSNAASMAAMGAAGGGGRAQVVNLHQTFVMPDGRVVKEQLISDATGRNVPTAAIRIAYP